MKRKNPLVLNAIKYIEIAAIAVSLSAFASYQSTTGQLPSAPTKTEYTLSVYDGRIAVFENSDSQPIEVFDVYVSSLPYNEQVELRNGLTAADRDELQRLIEDYTS